MIWSDNILKLSETLKNLSVKDNQKNELAIDKGFLLWKDITLNARENGRSIFFIGNGASASMASHFAADLGKNGRVRTEVFTDLALITAVANDISYDQVFAEPLRLKMDQDDILVAISSSGDSPNVLRAAEAAAEQGGTVITLSAMKAENKLRQSGNLNFYIPAQTYGFAETGHAAILHFWIDSIVDPI
ncbi:SIS domain-containing protein [Desulfococcaceae bacterium HSG7]|nr:SIS domain-containing protein [Desulfococcaceae bacterium HSG7]